MTTIETDYVKISSQGQLIIPKPIRENLGLEENPYMMLAEHNGTLFLRKAQEFRLEDIEQMKLLLALDTPQTTKQLAERLDLSRSYTSTLLNRLEKTKKVKESGRRGREVVYKRV